MLFSPDSRLFFLVWLCWQHNTPLSFLAARHRLLWKVIHAVLLSCIEITVCQFLCSPCSQSSVKVSFGVSPLIKLFAQVAHFAVTSSNCECEKTAFSQRVAFGCRSADGHSPLCSLSCLGKRPEIDFGWLEKPKISVQSRGYWGNQLQSFSQDSLFVLATCGVSGWWIFSVLFSPLGSHELRFQRQNYPSKSIYPTPKKKSYVVTLAHWHTFVWF